jgi:hypothetical protein
MTSITILESAQTSFARAATQFEADKRALFRADGAKKYGDQEHNERLQTLLQTLTEVATWVRGKCDSAIEAAQTAKTLQHADPLAALTNDELQRAFYLKPFIQDTVDGMRLDQLGQRLTAIVAGGDKAEIACYRTATERKVEAVRQRANTPGANQTIVLAGIRDVLPLIETMAGKLANPAHAKQLAEAKTLEKAAYDTKYETGQRLGELNGEDAAAKERFAQQFHSRF